MKDADYRWVIDRLKYPTLRVPQDEERVLKLQRRLTNITGPDEVRTSFHEAGHVVVAKSLSQSVTYVAINSDLSGETCIPDSESDSLAPPESEYVARKVTWMIAGFIAEEARFGQANPTDEYQHAVFLAGLHPDIRKEHAVQFVQNQETRARSILESNWYTVQQISDELIHKRRIEGQDLDELLTFVQTES